MEHLDQHIEALLFVAAEPLAYSRLTALLGVERPVLDQALVSLEQRLNGGIRLVRAETTVGLRTAPEMSNTVEQLLGDSGERDIGQAGLEVLSIILYEGPSTKTAIDFIRGVNSSSTLRTLVYRGLIERRTGSSVLEVTYVPTTDLLAHLGVTHVTQLPDRARIQEELAQFIARATPEETV